MVHILSLSLQYESYTYQRKILKIDICVANSKDCHIDSDVFVRQMFERVPDLANYYL